MTEFTVLALTADGKLPEWIRILPLGEVKLVDGREPFTVDLAAAETIVAAFRSRGVDLVIDYEHQSLGGDRAPAAGWIKDLQARLDGLWGRVEWTPQATEYLTNKEYRYFSPVLRLDPETRIPTALLHVGLTNVPAISRLTPLVAKAKDINGPQAGTPAPQQDEEATAMLKKLILKLGLQPEATEDEVLALVAGQAQEAVALKLQTAVLPELAQAVGLEATATPAQIKGAVLALKQGQEQLTTLQTEVAAGKLAPAQQEWALEYAARDLEGFKVYVEKAPKVVPVEALKLKTKDGKGEVSLTPEELTVCKSLGVAPEAFKAQKDQQAAA